MNRLSRTLLLASAAGFCLSGGTARAQTLQDALISAYRNNPQLQADRARQRATDEDVSRAWGGYRPQVVAQAQTGRAFDNIIYPQQYQQIGFQNINDSRSPQVGALQITQQIWDGNRTYADVHHSKYAVQNGLQVLTSTEQGVLGDAVQAYYDLYRDQQILAIQNEYVASLREELKATEERYRVKDVTQTDVAQARARLARGIADQQQYDGNVEASKSAFLRVVGFAPGNLPKPPPPPAAVPATLDESLVLAEKNPDLQAAIYAEKMAEADVESAQSGLLPDLSLQASASHATGNDQYRSVDTNGQVLLNLTVPLYDGGVASAKTRAAKHTAGQRRLEIDQERDRIVDQVKRSWENLVAIQARIASLKENAKAADVALKGVQQEMRIGSRLVIDELNARQEVLDTQIALRRSEHDEAISAYSLLVACGRLTAKGLELPVEIYDPKAHYENVNWIPWGPWIDTEYPESPKVKMNP